MKPFSMENRYHGSVDIVGRGLAKRATKYFAAGVVGDGAADDAPAIQAALDAAGQQGGSATVFLPPASVGYRITQGLKLPSYVTLQGASPVRYPFLAGNPNTSKIIADFADPDQYMIEPKTLVAGLPVAYNTMITGSLPAGATYNCGVRDLLLTSMNNVPFGGIRMHGCPGSTISNVGIHRVGCGALINFCIGGSYQVHTLTPYYGMAVWDDCNGNTIDAYAAQLGPYVPIVPSDYQLSFMANLNGQLIPTHSFGSNDHYQRTIGFMLGSTNSNSVSNTVSVVSERFADGIFMLNAKSAQFLRTYTEGDVNEVLTSIAAARSTYSMYGVHSFQSGTGDLFDLGALVDSYMNLDGIILPAAWGSGPTNDSDIRLGTAKPPLLARTNQSNIKYVDKDGDWITPTLNGGATIIGAPNVPLAYRISRTGRVEWRGGVAGAGATPFTITTVPVGFRPEATWTHIGIGCTLDFKSNGDVVLTTGGPGFLLDGASYEQKL